VNVEETLAQTVAHEGREELIVHRDRIPPAL
jgi:hypothetical protein